ncbi:MAG: Eco29kI family restriction endonuclease [Actinomycetota bacterium]|nr:Eco29kI family restriction endonuclease [Actinomycetota bacterium]
MPATPRDFDPLSTPEVTRTIRRVFEDEPLLPLPPNPFEGWGLYAIYYAGHSVDLYRPLANPELNIPVYVGRARRTSTSMGTESSRTQRRNRLVHHSESITGGGLPLDEFGCRVLLMVS